MEQLGTTNLVRAPRFTTAAGAFGPGARGLNHSGMELCSMCYYLSVLVTCLFGIRLCKLYFRPTSRQSFGNELLVLSNAVIDVRYCSCHTCKPSPIQYACQQVCVETWHAFVQHKVRLQESGAHAPYKCWYRRPVEPTSVTSAKLARHRFLCPAAALGLSPFLFCLSDRPLPHYPIALRPLFWRLTGAST